MEYRLTGRIVPLNTEVQVKSVSFLWVPATLVLVFAASWFALMELLLQHPAYEIRAAVAALIDIHGFLCLRYARTHDTSLRPVVAISALAIFGLGLYAIFTVLHTAHFEAYILIIAAALIAQSLLTLTQTLPRPHLHAA